MNARDHSWNSTDRAHERAGEADDDYDKQLADISKRQAAAMRSNALTGHWQTLEGLAESMAYRMSQRGNLENLIRTALSCGSMTAGQHLLVMINDCIAEDAETAALVEMDRAERQRAGGLDVAALAA